MTLFAMGYTRFESVGSVLVFAILAFVGYRFWHWHDDRRDAREAAARHDPDLTRWNDDGTPRS